MLPPEIQRIVLLISLAAVGYLLILAWTEDMEAAKAPIVYSDSPVLPQQPWPRSLTEQSWMNLRQLIRICTHADGGQATSGRKGKAGESRDTCIGSVDRFIGWRYSARSVAHIPHFPGAAGYSFLLMDRSASRTYIAQSALTARTALTKPEPDRSTRRHLTILLSLKVATCANENA